MNDTTDKTEMPATRRFPSGAVLHHHQRVHVAFAAAGADHPFPWGGSDYIVTDLGGESIRFVGLPLGEGSPEAEVSPDVVDSLLSKGLLTPREHDEIPEWGY